MSFADIIKQWPTHQELADDIGVPLDRALKWSQRDKIPQEYWADLLHAARKRSLPVTADILVAAAARQRHVA